MAIIGVFILIGLLILSSPFWAAKAAKNTVYVITDKRAVIVLKKNSEIEIKNFQPDELRDIDKRIFSDGSGDLIFDRQVSLHHSHKHGTHEHIKETGFFGIPAVNDVQEMLRALAQK